MDTHQDADVNALEQGYASVVPVKIDFTDFEMKAKLEGQWKAIL